jgi:ribonuclease VapC
VRTNLVIVAVDAEQVETARSAWRRFGKGRHPAALNFGDCFTYALARLSGEPVLAKGQDFALTDIELCKTLVPCSIRRRRPAPVGIR